MNNPIFTAAGYIRNGQFDAVSFLGEFESHDAAQDFISCFPKFVKAKACGSEVWMLVRVSTNGTTGEMNEAGLKRLRTFAKRIRWEHKEAGNIDLCRKVEAAIAETN